MITILSKKIRDNHFNASEEFKSEQAKAGDFEHTLKASILKLQQQIKEQTRTKVTYSVSVHVVVMCVAYYLM